MTRIIRITAAAALFVIPSSTRAQTPAAGTLPLTNISPEARAAYESGQDAYYNWLPRTALDHFNRALSIDSTFSLARTWVAFLRGGSEAAPQQRRATIDGAARPMPEQALIVANRMTGVNRVAMLGAMRAIYPNDRRLAMDYAMALVGTARIDSLRALTVRYPDAVGAKMWLAFYLTQAVFPTPSGEPAAEALRVAQALVQQAPQLSGSHAALGHVLERLGRHEEALPHLHQATRLSPHNEWAFVLKAEIHAREGRNPQLQAALDSATAASPHLGRQVNYREFRAISLLNENKAREAMQALGELARDAEARGLTAGAAGVHSNMAIVAAGTRDFASVDAHLAEARRLNLAEATLADARVIAFSLANRGDSARAALTDYVRLSALPPGAPPNASIRRMTGLTLLAEGKAAEAIPELQQGSENPYATLGIIEAYIKLGRNAEAEALRTQLLARKNTAWGSTAIPIARYRGLPRRT